MTSQIKTDHLTLALSSDEALDIYTTLNIGMASVRGIPDQVWAIAISDPNGQLVDRLLSKWPGRGDIVLLKVLHDALREMSLTSHV